MTTKGVSVALLAEMSLAAYQDQPSVTPTGWEGYEVFRTDYAFSVLFRNLVSNEWVLANRGTDEWISLEGVNNMGMTVADRLPNVLNDRINSGIDKTAWHHAHETLLQTAAIVGCDRFYVTGHSQGGALAILQAASHRLPGVVFNPMTPVLSSALWDRTDNTRFMTVRHREDIAGKATRRTVGRLVEIGEPDSWDLLSTNQELLIKVMLPPSVGYAYSIAKYARLLVVSSLAHLMGKLAYKIFADSSFHADLDWIEKSENE